MAINFKELVNFARSRNLFIKIHKNTKRLSNRFRTLHTMKPPVHLEPRHRWSASTGCFHIRGMWKTWPDHYITKLSSKNFVVEYS